MNYVALLRAINAGVTLPMADLRALAERLGFERPRTYIASGNLLFDSPLAEEEVRHRLEQGVHELVGKPVTVMIRTGDELAAVAANNPFAAQPGNKVAAIFLDAPPPQSALTEHRHRSDEEIGLGAREIYVHYPSGMGTSRLVIPAATSGTARNLNTVAKLAALSAAR